MRNFLKSGISFGLTSATITTLGMIVGLYSSTNSKAVVFGGILIIAFADAFSDSLGVHIAEESKNNSSEKEIWALTIFTFLSKVFFALTYAIPFLFLEMKTAIIVDIAWGYFLLGYLSYFIAKESKTPCYKIISEHLTIATLVIIITHFIGTWVSNIFV